MYDYADDDEEEIPEKDDFFEKSNAWEFSMKLPIKLHMENLENMQTTVFNDQQISKIETGVLHEQMANMDKKYKDFLASFVNEMDEKLRKLNSEKNKMIIEELAECNGLKNQGNRLTAERIKLQQDTLVLENKIDTMEKELGFRHKLSMMKKKNFK